MQNKRFYEIDLARAIVIITLVFTHVFEFWGDEYGYANILTSDAIEMLRYPAYMACLCGANVFMVCMGINMVLTRHNTPKAFFIRGLILLGIELVFNFARYALPGLIGIWAGGGSNNPNASMIYETMLYGMFNSDILAFSGLTFIVIAGLKKIKMPTYGIFITSIVMNIAGWAIATYASESISNSLDPNLSNFLGNFIWVNGDSTFPFIQWFIYPAIGMLFGEGLKSIENDKQEHKLFGITFIVSAIVFSLTCIILAVTDEDVLSRIIDILHDNNMDIVCTIAGLSGSFLFITIIYYIYHAFKLEKHEKANKAISDFSKDITFYYIIQWVIIGWVMFIVMSTDAWNNQVLGIGATIGCIIAIMIASFVIGRFLRKKIKK